MAALNRTTSSGYTHDLAHVAIPLVAGAFGDDVDTLMMGIDKTFPTLPDDLQELLMTIAAGPGGLLRKLKPTALMAPSLLAQPDLFLAFLDDVLHGRRPGIPAWKVKPMFYMAMMLSEAGLQAPAAALVEAGVMMKRGVVNFMEWACSLLVGTTTVTDGSSALDANQHNTVPQIMSRSATSSEVR
jgi:hypothetical protein